MMAHNLCYTTLLQKGTAEKYGCALLLLSVCATYFDACGKLVDSVFLLFHYNFSLNSGLVVLFVVGFIMAKESY